MRNHDNSDHRYHAREPDAWTDEPKAWRIPRHAPSLPEQREYVRQTAAKHRDRAALVGALLGETVGETASIYADAAGDPGLADLIAEALTDPPLAAQLRDLYTLADGTFSVRGATVVVLDDAETVFWSGSVATVTIRYDMRAAA